MNGFLPKLGAAVLGILLVASFLLDFNNTAQGGAIDLRNRVTGVRLLAAQIDPYFYKWSSSQPPEYCDPYNNPIVPVSKTTATPAMLLVGLPLAKIPYRLTEVIWFLLQWTLLMGVAWLWFRRCANSRQRWLLAVFVTGFTYTASWRLHAERGQAYVLLLFLFGWWLALTLNTKRGDRFLPGLLAGLLAALRPPFLLLLPVLALRKRGQLAGAGAGLLLGYGLPMLLQASTWSRYFSAMQAHSDLYRNNSLPPPGLNIYPATIEGVPTDILAHFVPISYADFSLHALLRLLGAAPFPSAPVMLAAIIPFALWLWLARRHPIENLILGVVAWFFLIDLFLPTFRNSYNDVLILNVVGLGLITSARVSWGTAICLAALPIGWLVYTLSPEQTWLINLPSLLFMLGAISYLVIATLRLPTMRSIPETRGGRKSQA